MNNHDGNIEDGFDTCKSADDWLDDGGSYITYGKSSGKDKGMTMKFTLDYETVDNITKGVLLELYEELKDTQEKMEADFDNLKDFQKEDYEYNKNLLEATKILVCYYTAEHERPEELTIWYDESYAE